MESVDAVVVGSGPNGLAAAATLARSGWDVVVLEGDTVAGGAVRSAELTVPGYLHDTFSAFYGLLHASPLFAQLGLDRRVGWARAPAPVAAAVRPGEVAVIASDPLSTAGGLRIACGADGQAWEDLWSWWRRIGTRLLEAALAPLGAPRPTLRLVAATRRAGMLETARMLLQPMAVLAAERLRAPAARALLAAGASHFDVGVDEPGSVPGPLILAMVAQEHGMPVPVGGAGRLAAALVEAVTEAGGIVRTSSEVVKVVVAGGRALGVATAEGTTLRARRAVLCDTWPAALFGGLVDEGEVPPRYLRSLRRFRHGTGVFKLDLALDGPVPWAAPELARCAVVHLTGDLDAMALASHQARHGLLPERPMLVVGQQSVADPRRAPPGCHTLWVETHVPPVPRGSSWAQEAGRFCDTVLGRLEEHAPGLAGRIVGLAVRSPDELGRENPNLVGGDPGGGSSALDQQLLFRPVPGWFRYRTPVRGLYLCSASTHPGGGVHGMAGRNAARQVLADRRRRRI